MTRGLHETQRKISQAASVENEDFSTTTTLGTPNLWPLLAGGRCSDSTNFIFERLCFRYPLPPLYCVTVQEKLPEINFLLYLITDINKNTRHRCQMTKAKGPPVKIWILGDYGSHKYHFNIAQV
jgi:hypothetical protein